ncbi:hypothetical protein PHJA_001157600 [Phtheirospermum japonicum]|uniref:Uncharacterized protein n=1 Tax=Phtheirospermum japonicum TaxID=374723 RepID=A0A830BQY3_9LAMI|nr:hypothetical protein PHJA_001157600 [Phtheirospermum japonicum]
MVRGAQCTESYFSNSQLMVRGLEYPIQLVEHRSGQKNRKADGLKGRHIKILASINLNEPLYQARRWSCDSQISLREIGKCVFYSGCLSHQDKACEKRKRDFQNDCLQEGQYGEWIKAADTPTGNKRENSYGFSTSSTEPQPTKPATVSIKPNSEIVANIKESNTPQLA